MTQSQKLIRAKLSLLELGALLKNVSEACRVMGVSRQHFYDIKKAYEEGGAEALVEQELTARRLTRKVRRLSKDLRVDPPHAITPAGTQQHQHRAATDQ